MSIAGLLTKTVYVYLPVLASDGQGGETVSWPSLADFNTPGRISQQSARGLQSADSDDSQVDATLYTMVNTQLARGARVRQSDPGTPPDDWVEGPTNDDLIWEVVHSQIFADPAGRQYQRSAIYRVQAGV